MVAIWQTTRQAWYRLIILVVVLHAAFYGMALIAIATDKQGLCIFFSVVYSVILLILGLAPDTFGVLLVGSVLWGLLPTTGAVANAITVVVKDFVRGVVYLAMVNSFMLFFLGTWNFGRYPGSAAVIIAAALMLGYWGVIYKGDEWFRKIVLWYGVGAIVISLLVSFFPGMVPGKGERALSKTEQLLDENQDQKLAKKQQDLQKRIQKDSLTRDQLSKEDREILEETRGFSRSGKAISGAEKAFDIATKPEHRMWWIIASLTVLLIVVFRVLKNSKIAAWLIAIAVIAGASLWIYREWDSVEKGAWSVKGFADKAIVEEVALSSVEGIELDGKRFDSASTRYFRIRILPDKDTYWGTCSDGEIFKGIAVQNERIRERFSRSADLSDGNIVIHGDGGTPSRDGELIQILQGSKPRVSLDIRKRSHPGCKTDAPLRASIQFIPETP